MKIYMFIVETALLTITYLNIYFNHIWWIILGWILVIIASTYSSNNKMIATRKTFYTGSIFGIINSSVSFIKVLRIFELEKTWNNKILFCVLFVTIISFEILGSCFLTWEILDIKEKIR